eukprot:1156263-Pelagomonas_calceolata.AAC.7
MTWTEGDYWVAELQLKTLAHWKRLLDRQPGIQVMGACAVLAQGHVMLRKHAGCTGVHNAGHVGHAMQCCTDDGLSAGIS